MPVPSNRVISLTALVLATAAALASLRIVPPFDTFAVVGSVLLAGVALASGLASRGA